MKKNRAKTVATLALAGALLTAPFAAEAASYKDVSANNWAYSHISKLSDLGIIKGYDDGTFKPKRNVSYLEILELLKGIQNPTSAEMTQAISTYGYIANTYKVPAWAKSAVCIALQNKVITESNLKAAYNRHYINDLKNDNQFPGRELAMVYYAKALGVQPKKDTSNIKVTDINTIGTTPKELIGDVDVKGLLASMIDAGIFHALGSDGQFQPLSPLQREQMAKITDLSYDYRTVKSFEGEVHAIVKINDVPVLSIKNKDGISTSFVLSKDTAVTVNGKSAKIEDISEGSKVKVKAFPQTGGNAPYQAVSVDVVSTELSGAGLIDELKYDEMKIAYSTNKDATVDGNFKAEKTDVFKLNKDTAITVLGKKAELRSLSTRDMVVFKAQDGVLKEVEVFPNKGTVSGEFVNYEYNRFGSTPRIILKLENKKEQAFIVKEDKTAKDLFELTNKLSKGAPLTLSTRYTEVISGKETEGKRTGYYLSSDPYTFGSGTLDIQELNGEKKSVLMDATMDYTGFKEAKKSITPFDVSGLLKNNRALIELDLVGGKIKAITVKAILKEQKDLTVDVKYFDEINYSKENGFVIGSVYDPNRMYTGYTFTLDPSNNHFKDNEMKGYVETAKFENILRRRGNLKLIYNLYDDGGNGLIANIRVTDGIDTIPILSRSK